MKKLVLVLFAALCICGARAQSDASHLTFMGIPIDGPLNAFVKKLQQKGLSYKFTNDNIAYLNGTFSAYKDCLIGVVAAKPQDHVCTVGVIFSEQDSWSNLSSMYFTLKDMLTQKYGKPANHQETFQAYSQPNDDQMKMLYVHTDKCKYATLFETKNGDIKLYISKADSYGYGCVILLYFDRKNQQEVLQQAYDDL